MKPVPSRSLYRTLFAVACLLPWVACGGDDEDITPPPPPSTATAPPTVLPTPPPAGAGLVAEIESASIVSDKVIVVFRVTDAAGNPVAPVLTSGQTEQQARVRFTVAHLEEYSGGGDLANTFLRYVNDVNLTQPAYDSRGTITPLDAAAGLHEFAFSTTLPPGYDPTETYSVAMQANRNFQGESFAINQVFDFVPAGGTAFIWSDVSTGQCNQCHDPLTAHGSRYEVRLCETCHTEAATDDEGTPIDFRVLIHKIHAGVQLPSVANGPPGSEYVVGGAVFAEKHEDGTVTGVAFPRALQSCTVCHANAPTAEYYREKPSSPACTACHDDVNPSLAATSAGPPGTNHFQNKGYPDGQCYACHAAEQGQEFDITVPGAHVIPDRSTQLKGLNVDIDPEEGVTNHAAGQMPTIRFQVTENDGTPITDLSGLNSFSFNLAGPTSDYEQVITQAVVGGSAVGQLVGPDGEGFFEYTTAAAIPADATGTWAVGAEARRQVMLVTTPEVSPKTVQEAAVNPVVPFSVDGSTVEARRVVVDSSTCGACHGEFSKDFSIHGNLRNQPEYCVLCHNPNASDFARRRRDPEAVAANSPNATIDFKVLIHKIHTGENLEQKPYIVYGFGPAPAGFTKHDFSEVLFSGNTADCAKCHIEDSNLLPPYPGTALPTLQTHIDGAVMPPVEVADGEVAPITSVCLSCHDGEAAIAHAQTQTAPDGAEACEVCHAEGRVEAVSEVHAAQ